MANEYINKVVANNNTLIDLTSDTAEASDVLEGRTLHLASGAPAVGTYRPSDEIVARLEATVGHSCKNLLDITKYRASPNVTVSTCNPLTGTIQASVSSGQYKSVYIRDEDIRYDSNKEYVVSLNCDTANANGMLTIRRRDNSSIVKSVSFSTTGSKTLTFRPADYEDYGWTISIFITSLAQTTKSINVSALMLRETVIEDNTFEPYQTPTDEKKQDKPVVLYDAGESSVGVHSVTELSNLTQYSELHITLFAPSNGDDPDGGFTHTIVHPFIFPNIPNSQVTCFDCRVAVAESGTVKYKQRGMAVLITNTYVSITEFDENANFIIIPSNHYIYIKRIVGIPK